MKTKMYAVIGSAIEPYEGGPFWVVAIGSEESIERLFKSLLEASGPNGSEDQLMMIDKKYPKGNYRYVTYEKEEVDVL